MLLISGGPLFAQRLAILVPDKKAQGIRYASALVDDLAANFKIIDSELSDTAFRSMTIETPFNMSAAEGRQIASVIGCDYFLVLRADSLRRTSFERPEYYEAFISAFLVDGRSGRLLAWILKNFESDSPAGAETQLFNSVKAFASELAGKIRAARDIKIDPIRDVSFEELPNGNEPAEKDFRPPVPYKRIKPEYTQLAYLFRVRATVDVLADIDAEGNVTRTEIERWAGFGLDESVIKAVRSMNWKPAIRNGRTLPMRVLLRYNFTKIEKD